MTIPNYPIIYDWIAVVVISCLFITYIAAYNVKHPSLASFLVVQIMILGLFIFWSNIFGRTTAELTQPLRTDQQVYGLTLIVMAAAATILNTKLNFDRRDEKTNK